MNESDFDALNEHLLKVRPLFDEFCARNSFNYVPRVAIGRYPRIRIQKYDSPKLWFDFSISTDPGGHRFEIFNRELPYELAAGAYIVLRDEFERKVRFQKEIRCFSGMPFDQVHTILRAELQKNLQIIEKWNAANLRSDGIRVHLRS